MEVSLGMLKISPRDFWLMTPIELKRAYDGTLRMYKGDTVEPATREDLERLMEKYPDGDT